MFVIKFFGFSHRVKYKK